MGAAAAACSSSSSNNSSGDGGGGGGDDSSLGGGSTGGGLNPFGEGGVPFGEGGFGMGTFNCHGPADCTEGGAGQACCFSTTTFAASCRTGPCGADYTQCATTADCPAGDQCVPSPLSMTEHYCAGGDGGTPSSEAGVAEGAAAETGASEAGGD